MEKSHWAHSSSLLPSAHNAARRPLSFLPQWAGIGSSPSVPAPALGRPSSAKHTPAPSPLSHSPMHGSHPSDICVVYLTQRRGMLLGRAVTALPWRRGDKDEDALRKLPGPTVSSLFLSITLCAP